MKKILFVLLLICYMSSSWAQRAIYTKAELNAVRVYRTAAEMQSTVKVSVPAGISEVVVGNIANQINVKTLQIAFNAKNVSILSSQYTDDYISDFELDTKNPKIKKVNDSIVLIAELIRKSEVEYQAYMKAIELLDKNQTVLVGSNVSTVEQLSKLTDYYVSKKIELTNKLEYVKNTKAKNEKLLARLKSSLKTSQERLSETYSDGVLVLKLMSRTAAQIKLDVSYLTNLASWVPNYEINGRAINQPLKFILKANVKQQSGQDWRGVKLTLVDGYPSQNNNAPILQPWFLQSNTSLVRVQGYTMNKKAALRSGVLMAEPVEEMSAQATMDEVVVGFESHSHTLNISYDVEIPYDILSNNEPHLISLNQQEIPAKFEYFSAPNINKEAFLVAKIKDFSQFNILNAPASIVFENMYIGETRINPNQSEDELKVTLGNDRRVKIDVVKVNDKSSDKFLSSYREKIVTYDLVIKNNKLETVSLSLEDRYPLSTDEAVKITLLENSGAKVDNEKAFLHWDLKLKPSEIQKIRVSYQVRYPKDFVISNL